MNEHCVLILKKFESRLFLFLVSQHFEMQVANDMKSIGLNLFFRMRDMNSGTRFTV